MSSIESKGNDSTQTIQWQIGAVLPTRGDSVLNPGVAGAFIGVDNGALLVAGGANFPDKMPWEGGIKSYHKKVYVFGRKSSGDLEWLGNGATSLPVGIAYGGSVSTPFGIVCVGGETVEGPSDKAFIMRWIPTSGRVTFDNLPDLPKPLTALGIGSVGNTVYVIGGTTTGEASTSVFSMNLDVAHPKWDILPDLPVAVTHAAVTVQSNGELACLYVMGGRALSPSGISQIFSHNLRYHIEKRTWETMSPIGNTNRILQSAGAAIATGSNYILLIGGDKGELFKRLETLNLAIEHAEDTNEIKRLQSEKLDILTNHPGFNKEVYLYNTVTDAWTTIGELPFDAPVTTTAVKWGDDIFVPSGEVRPGVRTPVILKGSIENKQRFSWIDSLVLFVCFLLMTLGRYLFTGKTSNTLDYFKGGQRIPQWAAAVSIFGAKLSAITFMGIPAKTYGTDWTYFFYLMAIVMIMPFVARFFIPFYRRLNVTSAYEYLSKRFNDATRLMASTLYILLQLGRMSIVVLLPSIALTLVTGINVNLCIVLIGIISIFFTVKGGIEVVIWVEVIQVLILATGALACLVYIPFQLDDWRNGLEAINKMEKLKVFDFRFDLTEPTLWVVLIGGLAIQLLTYGTDQTTVQRYLTTKTEKESVNSLRIGAWLTVPSTVVFFSLGTLLFLFFRERPDQVNIALENQDNIFPWFIVSQLPTGLSGLLIAGIFAASMSSTEASMNSTATLITTDFYKRWKPGITDRETLYFARAATLALGIFVTCISLYMAHAGVSSLWDQFNTILGLFTGCIGGAFILGIFTNQANGIGVVIGMLTSCLIQLLIYRYTQIHLLLYAFTGVVSCVLLGYFFSVLFVNGKKNTEGLTIHKTI